MYYIDWTNRIYGDKVKYIFFKDLERCPFLPTDVGYTGWNKGNDARLENLSRARTELKSTANSYLSHKDRNVRNMAHFVDSFLNE